MRKALLLIPLALAACQNPAAKNDAVADKPEAIGTNVVVPPSDGMTPPESETDENWPPAPGTPGGLPDDRTPVAEGKITPESPQGAAQVVQLYGALLEKRDFAAAHALWSNGGKSSGVSADAFAKSWDKYANIHPLVGGPGKPEGAAGSSYVTVPLQLYGTLKDGGKRYNLIGPVTLRRVNNVPGATAEQKSWRIEKADLQPHM